MSISAGRPFSLVPHNFLSLQKLLCDLSLCFYFLNILTFDLQGHGGQKYKTNFSLPVSDSKPLHTLTLDLEGHYSGLWSSKVQILISPD